MKNIPFIFSLFLLASCQTNTADQQQINLLQSELAKAKAEIAALQSTAIPPLVHVVYLNLKEDITEQEMKDLKTAIERLREIPVVRNLEFGKFVNLQDQRALADYDMIFQMNFANKEDYAAYQAHPIHLALKKFGKGVLAGPPATYDYMLSK